MLHKAAIPVVGRCCAKPDVAQARNLWGGGHQRMPGTCWLASLAKLVSFRFSARLSRKTDNGEWLQKTSCVYLLHLHVHTHMHMHAHVNSHPQIDREEQTSALWGNATMWGSLASLLLRVACRPCSSEPVLTPPQSNFLSSRIWAFVIRYHCLPRAHMLWFVLN